MKTKSKEKKIVFQASVKLFENELGELTDGWSIEMTKRPFSLGDFAIVNTNIDILKEKLLKMFKAKEKREYGNTPYFKIKNKSN